jgi:hypothetical protein
VHQVGHLTEINARCTVNKTLNFVLYTFIGGNIKNAKLFAWNFLSYVHLSSQRQI